jgi:hypothetical protein
VAAAALSVESWRWSRDEVMLVDCWEPAMGIKVMKGLMQKRGEPYPNIIQYFRALARMLRDPGRRLSNKSVCLPSTPLL